MNHAVPSVVPPSGPLTPTPVPELRSGPTRVTPLGRVTRVQELASFKQVVYSSCWEDSDTELEALAVGPTSRVLSITASGGRSLNLLEGDPARLISVDVNPAQSALLELKAKGLLHCRSYEAYGRFLGLFPGSKRGREEVFQRDLAPHLSPSTRRFWAREGDAIRAGVLRCGRQDRLIERVRPAVHALRLEERFAPLFEFDDLDAQGDYWDAHVGTAFVRALTMALFSKPVLSFIYGRDIYEDAETFDMGKLFFEKLRTHARTRLFRENYLLSQVMLARYLDPRRSNSYYLREAAFEEAAARVGQLEIQTAPLEDVLATLPDGSIDAFSYSDIFDWIAPVDFQKLMRETVRVASDGARICYRVCLLDRYPELDEHFVEDREVARELFLRDRSVFYKDLYVATIRK